MKIRNVLSGVFAYCALDMIEKMLNLKHLTLIMPMIAIVGGYIAFMRIKKKKV